MSKLTLITNIFNEEYLLPYWLKHHRTMFDHGIILDWHSTDKSLEICRELVPDWEIVTTKNQFYTRSALDPELIEIERRVDGWKSILHTTEFVFHPDLRGYLDSLSPSIHGVWMPPISLIDTEPDTPLNPDMPLVLQKTAGCIGKGTVRPTHRFVHRLKDGQYKGEGRHDSFMRNTFVAADCFHVWLGFCPWNQQFRDRKLQIKTKMEPSYIEGAAKEEVGYHLLTEDEMNNRYLEYRKKYCRDLFQSPVYSYLYNEIAKSQNKNYKFDFSLPTRSIDFTLARISSIFRQLHLEYFYVIKHSTEQQTIANFDVATDRCMMDINNIAKFVTDVTHSIDSMTTNLGPLSRWKFTVTDTATKQIVYESKK